MSSRIQILDFLQSTANYGVLESRDNTKWTVGTATAVSRKFPEITKEIKELLISEYDEDELIWDGSTNGVITVAESYESYREKTNVTKWFRHLWPFITPRVSVFAWKVLSDRITTTTRLFKRKIILSGVCLGCIQGVEEDIDHLILHCQFAKNICFGVGYRMSCV